jgi:TolA-binding protein
MLFGENYGSENVETLKYKLAQQKERIDGLTRIVEGMAQTINELRENRSGGRGSPYSDEELIRRLGKMVDNINENYVSKAELKRALDNLKDEYGESVEREEFEPIKRKKPPRDETIEADLENSEPIEDKLPKERIYRESNENVESDNEEVVTPRVFDEDQNTKPVTINDTPTTGTQDAPVDGSNASQYALAVRLYNKKEYNQAKLIFLKLEKEEFKVAPTSYYLGEIAYFSKRYEDAIYYFKKSAKLYPKASYMHTLLLHSAISLEKSDQKSEAVKFYRKIVNEYPDSSSVGIAKMRLEKLQ